MTNDQIQSIIETFDGWKPGPNNTWENAGLGIFGAASRPKYGEDLNACHNVEWKLTPDQHGVFRDKLRALQSLTGGVYGDYETAYVSAPAEDRAEALAETILDILKARAEIAAESAAPQASAGEEMPTDTQKPGVTSIFDPAQLEEDEELKQAAIDTLADAASGLPTADAAPAVAAINV